MKMQIFYKMRYDLKYHYYVMESFQDYFHFQPFWPNYNLDLRSYGNFCHCFFSSITNNELYLLGSIGIAPTLDCTHFLEIGIVVAGGGFYSYYIHQDNKLDEERKILKGFMHTKDLISFFKDGCNPSWVHFHVYHLFRWMWGWGLMQWSSLWF